MDQLAEHTFARGSGEGVPPHKVVQKESTVIGKCPGAGGRSKNIGAVRHSRSQDGSNPSAKSTLKGQWIPRNGTLGDIVSLVVRKMVPLVVWVGSEDSL